MDNNQEFQKQVFKLLAPVLSSYGYALSGSGAIRAYGLIDRPTEDIDLFSNECDKPRIQQAIDVAIATLKNHGYEVVRDSDYQSADFFARLHVSKDEHKTDIDMSVDWRALPPVELAVGPVLSPRDAVGSKLLALTFRGEARDFLDAMAIKRSGLFTDLQLYEFTAERDETFRPQFLMEAINNKLHQPDSVYLKYVSRQVLNLDKEEARKWAESIFEQYGPATPLVPGESPQQPPTITPKHRKGQAR